MIKHALNDKTQWLPLCFVISQPFNAVNPSIGDLPLGHPNKVVIITNTGLHCAHLSVPFSWQQLYADCPQHHTLSMRCSGMLQVGFATKQTAWLFGLLSSRRTGFSGTCTGFSGTCTLLYVLVMTMDIYISQNST